MFPEIFRGVKPDIHTPAGQRQTRRTLRAWEAGMKAYRRQLKKQGYNAKEIQRGLDPMECFQYDLQGQVEEYERAKKGLIHPTTSLEYLGRPLIMARIARGWSRKALAKRLEVSESEVIRFEKNDYHGVPMDTIRRIAVLLRLQYEIKVRLLKKGKQSNDQFYWHIYHRSVAEKALLKKS